MEVVTPSLFLAGQRRPDFPAIRETRR